MTKCRPHRRNWCMRLALPAVLACPAVLCWLVVGGNLARSGNPRLDGQRRSSGNNDKNNKKNNNNHNFLVSGHRQPWSHPTAARIGIHSARTPRRSESREGDAWKGAYDLELERNRLLREQLGSSGSEAALPDSVSSDTNAMPDACEISYEDKYESLVSCNKALVDHLNRAAESSKAFEDMRDVAAKLPSLFKVPLSQTKEERSVQLVRFFGKNAAFFLVHASLPLGLKLTKRESGPLQGAFVVEEVLHGGSAERSGLILPGDVLQALTVVAEGPDRSGWTDVMSNFVGGLEGGSLTQTLLDATLLGTLDDLVAAIQGNKELGPAVELTLILERDAGMQPAPAQCLTALEASETTVQPWTDGLASKSRSTDIK
ncbi:unnamed protein product [Polarella glacialis]|uniref:PDZ domain-containing protein n=1 Tax=Polarella glacialis TaxID=89957 RepID=A0A813J4J2_POLGL|nr:unnamed protein product [Polarella glacialis]